MEGNKLETTRKRGVRLTVWFVFLVIIGLFSVLSNTMFRSSLIQVYPDIPVWAFSVFAVLSLLVAIFTLFLFFWKRCAFYGLLAISVIAFLLNLYVGAGTLNALIGFVVVAILYLLIRPKWHLFT
tara:strand:- start:136 stop:510 length:375 start_codon:yes stop_codon:yes gene_type:complete